MPAFVALLIALATTLAEASPKRARPDYDGRGNPDAKPARRWLLWIPRVALAPLYVVNEYVLRRPIGAVMKRAERGRWLNEVGELFRFGAGGKTVTVPTVLLDLGRRPRIGVYVATHDLFTPGNALSLHAAGWGISAVDVTVRDRFTWKRIGTSLAIRGELQRAPDLVYFGTGPDVTRADRVRYGITRYDGSLVLRQVLSRAGGVTLAAGARAVRYRAGELDLGDPYEAFYQRLAIVLDTRPPGGSGGYLEMHAEHAVTPSGDRRWLATGALGGLAIDLNGRQRTLHAQLAVRYVDPLRGDEVPFAELAAATPDEMPGFLEGWMLGRSTFTAQLGYTWPVYAGLSAQTRLATGNAFGGHLAGLGVDKLRLSWDVGFTTSRARDQGFELLFGLGTETLERGADLTSVRVSFGSRRAF